MHTGASNKRLINARPIQRDVILATLDGQDVFLQAATSFGKSLCFQLPAVIDHGGECLSVTCTRPVLFLFVCSLAKLIIYALHSYNCCVSPSCSYGE
jgi:DEAD/DEAH box helicase